MLFVVPLVFAVDEHIVEICGVEDVEVFAERVINIGLEGSWAVVKAEGQDV